MRKSFVKTGIAALLVLFVFSGCQLANSIMQRIKGGDTTPTTTPTTQPTSSIAPYYANGDIEYYAKAVSAPLDQFVNESTKQNLISAYATNYSGTPDTPPKWSDVSAIFHLYEVGTIKGADFKDWKLVLLDIDCQGPCFTPNLYRFAYNKEKNELTLLQRHSSEEILNEVSILSTELDNVTLLKGIEPPESIKIPNSDKTLELTGRYTAFNSEEPTKLTFTDPEYGNVYERANNDNTLSTTSCFTLNSPDGSTSIYGYDPHFFKSTTVYANWKDGSPKTNISDEYTYMPYGCGSVSGCYITRPWKDEELELVGTATNNIDLYVAKDPQENIIAKDENGNPIGNDINTAQKELEQVYNDYKVSREWTEQAKKPLLSFADFVKTHPLLYWKDPFNRLIPLQKAEYKPAAECGKPVIYLYPEKTTDVSVQVNNVELTKTIPTYGKTGWTVQASPDGTIYNYADKTIYPYLFWEAKKYYSTTLDKGFSVKRDDLPKFLDSSLTKLGLSTQEKKDFIEFWLPRMLANTQEYFFVTFYGTQDFNKVAPLTIIPKPNTLIRVFMYYMPMNQELSLPEQKLTAIARHGFTVVEWGGSSSQLWAEE